MATATQDTKAQDTNKAPAAGQVAAPVVKAPTRTKEEILDLLTKGSVDAALFEELKKINEGEAKKKDEKKGTVTKLVAEMEKYGITFVDLKEAGAQVSDIDKLFDANTIKLAAGSGATKSPKAKKAESDGTPKESKKLMIALPSNGKRPAGYGKGDTLGTYTKPAFKELFTQHGDKFESVMEGHRTEEGKVYYATPEGKKEWAALIEHIKTKKVAPAK